MNDKSMMDEQNAMQAKEWKRTQIRMAENDNRERGLWCVSIKICILTHIQMK